MAKLHELPNNDLNYYRKAMNALQANNYQLGLDYLTKSFELDQNLDIFKELVDICISLGEKDRLKDLWETYFPDPNRFHHEHLLVELWLASVAFLYPLQEAINLLTQTMLSFQNQGLDTALSFQPILSHLLSQQTILSTIHKLRGSQYPAFITEQNHEGPMRLLETLKITYTDPTIPFKFYQTILEDKDILNFIKSDILHYLISQECQETINLAWSDQIKTLKIGGLNTYKEMKHYQEGLQAIQNYFSQHDPHLMDDAIQIYNLHYQVFYPYPEKVLPTGDAWLQAFLALNFNQNSQKIDSNLLKTVKQAQEEIQIIIRDPS